MTGDQLDLFSVDPATLTRSTDPETSTAGAVSVCARAGSQKHRLLTVFAGPFADRHNGLTDYEAAGYAGLLSSRSLGYWKRCSDLRREGLIVPTGETRRSPDTGELVRVCEITDLGRRVLEEARRV